MIYSGKTALRASINRIALTAFLTVLIVGVPLHGQIVLGTIDGNVSDASQAAVANAQVKAVNTETNLSRDTVTSAAGAYTLPNLPPGTYSVTVTSAGFQTSTLAGLTVTGGNVTRGDLTLKLGTVSETITVGAEATALQTDRAEIRSEINQNVIANVPVPVGRNYQMLLTTLPGVAPPQNANSYSANPSRAVQFSINGNLTTVNNTRIDGTSAYNVTAPQAALYGPALEAISGVSIVTNSFDAEQATAGGGAVNVTVKSGANSFHGSLFEDHSDQAITAYAWPANRTLPKSKYIFNQYGATIGGPILKDKLFYFVSWEGTRFVAAPPIQMQLPTAAMKLGDLSASPTPIYDPTTGNANGTGRTAFMNNKIPVGMISPAALAILQYLPNPNQKGTGAFGLGNDYLASASGGQNRDQIDSKVNWNATDKLSMFVRFGFNNNNWFTPQPFGIAGGPTLSSTNTATGNGFGHLFNDTVSGTYIFTPHLLMDASFGYSRNDNSTRQTGIGQNYGDTLLHIPGLSNAGVNPELAYFLSGMPQFTVAGFASIGSIPSAFEPYDYSDAEHDYVSNINWIRGTHDLRAGIDLDRQGVNEWQAMGIGGGNTYSTAAGGFNFTQGTTQLSGGPAGNDFNAWASFLLGTPANAGRIYVFPPNASSSSLGSNMMHTTAFGAYIRDRWQVSPKLTLTYGVRWEYFGLPNRGGGRGLEYLIPQTNTMNICGLGNAVPENCGITTSRERPVPRVGIAYRVTDSFVVRAGAGLANDPTSSLIQLRLNAPYVYTQILSAPNSFGYATTLSQGIPAVTAPNLSGGPISWPGNANALTLNNGNWVRGYMETWNLTLEKRFKGWVGSLGYAGTRAIDPRMQLEQNWGSIGTGAAGQQYAPYGRTASVLLFATEGSTKYDALQAHLQHSFSSGFQIAVSYTFSKTLGFANVAATNGSNGTPPVAIPAYYGLNYGPMQTNVPQNFQTTWVYQLPFGKGKPWLDKGIGAAILGGWQLSSVLSAYSGLPFTATASATSLNAVNSTQFASCIAPADFTGGIQHLYSTSTFAVPATGAFGTCGINRFHGPAIINMDAGLERTIPIKERFEIKFRAEMFNVANTPHHAPVNATNASVNASTFMNDTDIANTGREGIDQRAARFSLKVTF